jgi:hypothetical protein
MFISETFCLRFVLETERKNRDSALSTHHAFKRKCSENIKSKYTLWQQNNFLMPHLATMRHAL